MTKCKQSKELPEVEAASKSQRVLSTSLGVLLAGQLMLAPAAVEAASAAPQKGTLAEWSAEEVKEYFDPQLDWSLPIQPKQLESTSPGGGTTGSAGNAGSSSVSSHGGGFGWDDLLLYHMIFGHGRAYSSSGWTATRPVVDSRTKQTYQPRSYSSGAFTNKPMPGSVAPTTTAKTGSFSTKSAGSSTAKATSAPAGSIGGKSSGFSSSSKSSSSSFSS